MPSARRIVMASWILHPRGIRQSKLRWRPGIHSRLRLHSVARIRLLVDVPSQCAPDDGLLITRVRGESLGVHSQSRITYGVSRDRPASRKQVPVAFRYGHCSKTSKQRPGSPRHCPPCIKATQNFDARALSFRTIAESTGSGNPPKTGTHSGKISNWWAQF